MLYTSRCARTVSSLPEVLLELGASEITGCHLCEVAHIATLQVNAITLIAPLLHRSGLARLITARLAAKSTSLCLSNTTISPVHGHCTSSVSFMAFNERKRTILATLAEPSETYTDASPKGSVDEGIRELVDEINALDGFVTTSSCAGRIAVYQEGVIRTAHESVSTRAGGKGGGHWLFVSHDPVRLDDLEDGNVLSLLSLPPAVDAEVSDCSHGAFVHLKFEPLVSSFLLLSNIFLILSRSFMSSARH